VLHQAVLQKAMAAVVLAVFADAEDLG
jgi:hypothetical protein